tara:strand:- start:2855 stop:3598 length:744 start_codon:yes stop_codon:yes gene_type:complete
MSYFIFDGVLNMGKQYELKGEEFRHITKSRRVRPGDSFLIQDTKGQRFNAILKRFDSKSLLFTPNKPVAIPPASSLRLEILQAIPKQKALDFILQKTTELGVSRLDVFCGIHSPKTFNASENGHHLKRWHRVVSEASKQCERQFAPEIHFHTDINSALETLPECPNSWMLDPKIADSISWKKISKIGNEKIKHHRLLIGPEGGLHKDEIKQSLCSGMRPLYLGPRILRSETAAISAVSILQFLWGDL